jgi:glycosyltransferase involved in cell wall biosynthesis
MKILLIAPQPFYQERGTPIAVRQLIETLCAAGHGVHLLTYHEGEDVEIPGLKIFRIPKPPWIAKVPIGFSWKKVVCDLYLSAKMVLLLRKSRYQVIHAVEESIFPAAAMNILAGSKLVYDMDSLLSEQIADKWKGARFILPLLSLFEKIAVRRSDLVMPMCERLAQKAKSFAPGKPVAVVEDIPLIDDNETAGGEELREAFNIKGVLALYVGNLEPYQGIDLLLESFALLDGEAGIDVVVVGGGAKEVEHYRKKADRIGVGGQTHFTGHRPIEELGHYLNQADLLLSPRISGMNTPMKIYSYLAAGKPVLATEISSHTQALDSSCAVLVPPDPAAMAAGLENLGKNSELRRELGTTGRDRAKKRYSRESFRKKVLAAYRLLESDR